VSAEFLQEVVVCIGQPLDANPLQFMMERAFRAAQLDWRYLMLEVAPDDLKDAVRGIRALGFAGATVTTPHKVAVIPLLGELTEAADLMGAVNCIFRKEGQLIGDNANGAGFLEALKEKVDPAEKRVLLLGAGGMARSIAVELALAGAKQIRVADRAEEKASGLATLLGDRLNVDSETLPLTSGLAVPDETDIVINATPVGFGDSEAKPLIKTKTLAKSMVVADVTFHPADTRLIREAADLGCTTVTGPEALLNQAVKCFRTWTSCEPDRDVMREAIDEFFGI
jgi:shikimate dehydrogenase